MACACFLISGRVQGVFFRAATREQARRLELVGWAENLADGRVEVYARGTPVALDELERWLWQGPPAAKVTTVQRRVADDHDVDDFATR
jgi:acylphosphatase